MRGIVRVDLLEKVLSADSLESLHPAECSDAPAQRRAVPTAPSTTPDTRLIPTSSNASAWFRLRRTEARKPPPGIPSSDGFPCAYARSAVACDSGDSIRSLFLQWCHPRSSRPAWLLLLRSPV